MEILPLQNTPLNHKSIKKKEGAQPSHSEMKMIFGRDVCVTARRQVWGGREGRGEGWGMEEGKGGRGRCQEMVWLSLLV